MQIEQERHGMNGSKIDDFFQRIYGFLPRKKGASYELLVAAAFKLIHTQLKVQANQFVEGTHSKQRYQIDVLLGLLETAIEAKDYTDRNVKVGRPDVTKLAGSLQDLPFSAGIIASATDFTMPARKYASATKQIPSAKPIELYQVRPSVAEDEQGRIRKIVVKLYILILDRENCRFDPIISSAGREKLSSMYSHNQQQLRVKIDSFYKSDGTVLITLADLTSRINGAFKEVIEGSWKPPQPAFLQIGNELIEIDELRYYMPQKTIESEIVVEATGTAELLIKGENGAVDKLLTDVDLRSIRFSQDHLE